MTLRNPTQYLEALTYHARDDRLLSRVLSRGSVGVRQTADLAVAQNGTPNMSVNIAAGEALFAGTEATDQGTYTGFNDAVVNLAVAASDPTNPRNDLVVLTVRDDFYSTHGGSPAANTAALQVITGTPNASPVDPATPANSIVLARIRVNATVTTIVNANITDLRQGLAFSLPSGLSTAAQVVNGLFSPAPNVVALASNSVEVARTGAGADLQISTGRLLFSAAASKIVPGATSFSLRNNADSADNVLIANNGAVTFSPQSGAGSWPIKIVSSVASAGGLQISGSADPNLGFDLNNTGAGGREYSFLSCNSGGILSGALVFYDSTGGGQRLAIGSTGGVLVGAGPTGGDKGAGTINVQSAIYLNNTAYTNPDYVLERWARGRIQKFIDRPGAKTYPGVMPLSKLEAYARRHLRLPRVVHGRPVDVFERADITLEKIEEIFIHLFDFDRRMRALEATR